MESHQLPEIVPEESVAESEVVELPLRDKPVAGMPELITELSALKDACNQLAKGTGPIAIDAERASGYKYSQRAYLIQIHRKGGGLHLIDPIPFKVEDFAELNEILQSCQTIIHASTQDLPCMREIGLNPTSLFDTELGARIAGMAKVGLGPLTEELLGFRLAKEHSAVDWSIRPLHQDWLIYAALDVELLVELRNHMYAILEDAKKLPWALEEFASILKAPPAPARVDPWRRTSGMHKIKRRDQLAVIKSLWIARDAVAAKHDIAAGKLLNDSAIVELAIAVPTNKKEFEKCLRPLGLRARWLENLALWLDSIATAVALPEDQWPAMRTNADTLPPIKLWRDKFPEKFAPLSHARAALELISQENQIPVENLITPEHVRRICWKPPIGATSTLSITEVEKALSELGARQWQIDLVAPALAAALLEREPIPVEVPEPVAEEA
mgnify:CR=1 FL=1